MNQSMFRRFMGKMILQNFIVFSGAIFNGIAISRYLGTEAIAGFQLTLPVFFIVSMLSQLISIGVQNNCAKSTSLGRLQAANEYYSTAVAIVFPISVLMSLLTFWQAEPLAMLIGSEGSETVLLDETADYLRGVALGFPFLMLLPMQVSILFLEGRSKWSLWSGFVQTAVKIIAIFVNIFCLEGGMFGMGMVMTLGYGVGLLVTMAGMRGGIIRFSRGMPRLKTFARIFRIGFPYALDRLYKSVYLLVVNRALIFFAPATALHAFADINVVNNILMPIVMGASSTMLTMAGVFSGERDKRSLEILLRTGIKNGVLVAVGTAALVFAAAPFLIELLVKGDAEVFDATVRALRIYIWSLPFFALNNLLQKYYLGINAMKMTYLTSALDNLVFICLFSVVLGYFFGADGVWVSFLLAELATTAVILGVIAWRNGCVPKRMEDLLFLPKNFGDSMIQKDIFVSIGSIRNIIDASEDSLFPPKNSAASMIQKNISVSADSIRNIIDALENLLFLPKNSAASTIQKNISVSADSLRNIIDASEEARQFLLFHGAASRDAALMALVIEEMGGNIIRWGMATHIDIRIVKNDVWILRIRDDGGKFNPKEWLKIHQAEESSKNIGIRMICRMTSDLRYARLLDFNYLIVRL